jgi:hypothetical protein
LILDGMKDLTVGFLGRTVWSREGKPKRRKAEEKES